MKLEKYQEAQRSNSNTYKCSVGGVIKFLVRLFALLLFLLAIGFLVYTLSWLNELYAP